MNFDTSKEQPRIILPLHTRFYIIQSSSKILLLVVPKEHFNPRREPVISADLEAAFHTVQLGHFLLREFPAVEFKVCFDSRFGNALRNDAGATLEAPHQSEIGG